MAYFTIIVAGTVVIYLIASIKFEIHNTQNKVAHALIDAFSNT